MYLIDSDWVIGFLRGQQASVQLLASLRPDGLAISIITFIEIYEGIYLSRNTQQAEQGFRTFLVGTTILGVTRRVAKRNARLRGTLRQQGSQINHRALDLIIASTALTHNLTLVTRNRRDYNDIPGLKLL